MGTDHNSPTPDGGSGPRIGQFRLIERVGVSLHGIQFQARLDGDFADAPSVALNVLRRRTHPDRELTLDVVQQKAQPVPSLRHPNLVRYHECGRVGDRLFLVSDYQDGLTLSRVLQVVKASKIPLDEATIMAILQQLARGLDAIHSCRIGGWNLQLIHGGLRPDNVLLLPDGTVKLADYGLGFFIEEFTREEKNQPALTPPVYLSPEQVRKDPLTQASDIFVFAAIAAELSTGKAVFNTPKYRGSLQKVKKAVVSPTLTKVRNAVPSLALVLENCFQLDPERRYPEGMALSQALQEASHLDDGPALIQVLMDEVLRKADASTEPRGMSVDERHMLEAVAEATDRVSFSLPAARTNGSDGRASEELDEEQLHGTETGELGETEELGDTEDLDINDASATIKGALSVADVLVSAGDAGVSWAEGLPSPADIGVSGQHYPGEEDSLFEDSVSVDVSKPAEIHPELDRDEDVQTTSLDTEDQFTEEVPDEEPSVEKPPVAAEPKQKPGRIPRPPADATPPVPTVRSRELQSYAFKRGAEPEPARKLWPWIVAGATALLVIGAVAMPFLTEGPVAPDRDAAAEQQAPVAAPPDPVAAEQPSLDEEPAGIEGGTEDGSAAADEPTTPLLDPAILTPPEFARMPLPDPIVEPADHTVEDPPDTASPVAEPPRLTHQPAARGIRGRSIQLTAAVSPPGAYSGTLRYRASGGSWQSASFRGGEDGTLSATIPAEARADGDGDAIEYYIEVVGAGGSAGAGSSASPFRVKLY